MTAEEYADDLWSAMAPQKELNRHNSEIIRAAMAEAKRDIWYQAADIARGDIMEDPKP
jgi:hypothetical protein